MTTFGDIPANSDLATDNGYIEVTGQNTTSTALVDIPGCTFNITLDVPGRISAMMTVEASMFGAPGAWQGGWAININGVDGGEIKCSITTVEEPTPVAVQFRNDVPLAAGTYVVKGRHRIAAGVGTNTLRTDVAQLSAHFVG
jgi:hypothetical protein